jgi:hypothetical protein
MWQRFTERARRVILLGQEEAGKMSSSHVGTEHLLLGLVREDEGRAAQVLIKMGVLLQKVREEIAAEVTPTDEKSAINEPKLTPRAKRVLEFAADEARRMRQDYIGTEHMLIGLLREKQGKAANVLRRLGLDLEKARNCVQEHLGAESAPCAALPSEPQPTPETPKPPAKDSDSFAWIFPLLTRLLPRELREMRTEWRSASLEKSNALLRHDHEAVTRWSEEVTAIEQRMTDFMATWEASLNQDAPTDSRMVGIVTKLITEIETALDALSTGETVKLEEAKERLAGLKSELRGNAEGGEDQNSPTPSNES